MPQQADNRNTYNETEPLAYFLACITVSYVFGTSLPTYLPHRMRALQSRHDTQPAPNLNITHSLFRQSACLTPRALAAIGSERTGLDRMFGRVQINCLGRQRAKQGNRAHVSCTHCLSPPLSSHRILQRVGRGVPKWSAERRVYYLVLVPLTSSKERHMKLSELPKPEPGPGPGSEPGAEPTLELMPATAEVGFIPRAPHFSRNLSTHLHTHMHNLLQSNTSKIRR